jgi:thioesterase domain-containing protein
MIDQNKPGWRMTPRTVVPALFRILANIPLALRDALAQAPGTNRLQKTSSILLHWARAAFGIRKNAVAVFGINQSETELIYLFESHLRALREYQPQPALVPITLFRAGVPLMSHAAMDPMLGWADLTKHPVRVYTVPGNHSSMTTEPLVRQLADALSIELNAAQSRNDKTKKLQTSPLAPLSNHRRKMTVA